MSMCGFYWRLLRGTPVDAKNVWESAVAWLAFGLTALLLINPELGKWVQASWVSASRWWAVVPFVAVVIWRIASNNYRAFQQLESQISTRKDLEAFTERLGELMLLGRQLQDKCEAGTTDESTVTKWETTCVRFLQEHPQHYGASMASRFQAAKEIHVSVGPVTDALTITHASMPGTHQRLWRRLEKRVRLLPMFISEISGREFLVR
jgi:hypothetical protein